MSDKEVEPEVVFDEYSTTKFGDIDEENKWQSQNFGETENNAHTTFPGKLKQIEITICHN